MWEITFFNVDFSHVSITMSSAMKSDIFSKTQIYLDFKIICSLKSTFLQKWVRIIIFKSNVILKSNVV